jgi:hypothetical protein
MQWLERVMSWSLNTPYPHVVFTVPRDLNELVAVNPELLRLLFRCAFGKLA